MRQKNKKSKGVLALAFTILLFSLFFGLQSAKAADGNLNTAGGIVLKDTNANGKIDEVEITVDYAAGVANSVIYATNEAAAIGKFTVTDTVTGNPVTVNSIMFVSGNGTVAVFKLVLNETDFDLSVNTSATALNVAYNGSNAELKITDGSHPVNVASIASGIVEKDGAKPIAVSAAYKDLDFNGMVDIVDVSYSENLASSIFTASEWSFPSNPHSLTVSSGSISSSDVLIAVNGAPAGNTALNTTTVKYTAGTGINDGINTAATSSALTAGDKAQPIILTAVDQSSNSLDGGTNIPSNANIIISFSEPMDTVTLDANSERTISPDPGTWSVPVWSNFNKTVTMTHTNVFSAGAAETVTLSAPLAVSGVAASDKALKNNPIAAAVNNPFSFTVAGSSPASSVSAYKSTVSASPAVLIADGVQFSTIIVVVKNSAGSVMPDRTVVLSSSRGAKDTITAITSKTGSDGIASFKASSNVAGKSVITAATGSLNLVQSATINFLPIGSEIGNPANPDEHSGVTLYRVPGDPRVYVIKNKKKHWIKTEKEFDDDGYDWSKIQEVSSELLAKFPEAENLVSELLKAIGDPRVYIIKEGKKHWIKTAEEFNAAGYNWDSIQEVSPETLAAYQDIFTSNLLRIKGDYKVYVIENGKKHWIKTAEEFNAAGYDWNGIQDVASNALAAYPDSEQVAALVKIVKALSLRVRGADTVSSAVLDTVKKNETYQVIEKKNGWYKIKTKKGKAGWISGSYASEE